MATVYEVLAALERVAPPRFALSFDRIGHQFGDPHAPVTRAIVALDPSLGLAAQMAQVGAQLCVTHHPAIWEPLKNLTPATPNGRFLLALAAQGAAAIAAHTNWDAAPGGINDTLAERLELTDIVSFGDGALVEAVKLVVFTPAESTQTLLEALSAAGAGRIGNYERCAFFSEGTGTFRGLPGSRPAVGEPDRVEAVPEVRLETRVPVPALSRVIKALRRVHPYEEPAFDLIPLRSHVEQPLGRMGNLPEPMPLQDLAAMVDHKLETRCLVWGSGERRIRTLAVVGGAADESWIAAQRSGADALLTGEVKQHVGLHAAQEGMTILQAGHYATEHPGMEALASRLAGLLPEVEFQVYAPPPGTNGRPL